MSTTGRRALRSTIPGPALDDEHSMQTRHIKNSTRLSILSMPMEIRDMIYRLVLFRERPLRIISTTSNPHIDHVSNSTSIIYVNKQISDEALPILYSTQTFEFTNGIYSPDTDAKVLKSFIVNTRPHLLASITSMNLFASLRMGYAANMHGTYRLVSGDASYASSFREMCKYIIKHLTNIRSVIISFGPWGKSIHAMRLLSRSATLPGLAKSIRMIMQLPNLKRLKLIDTNVEGFNLLLDKVIADEGAAGRFVSFTNLPASHLTVAPSPPPLGVQVITETRTEYLLSW